MPGGIDGRLLVSRFSPTDQDALRLERISTAFDRKMPKLVAWKAKNAISVLVLENNDIALTNHLKVADTVEKIIASRKERPDEVWLVDAILDEWFVWRILSGEILFPDGDTDFKYRAFSPSKLSEV